MIRATEERQGYVQESRWTDADEAFAHGLESWNTGPEAIPIPLVPRRIFNAWIEEWEWECLHHNDPVAEARLMQKYGGLRWIDPDGAHEELCIADQDNMEFQGGRGSPGWCIIGTRESDGGMEPWQIEGGDVIDLIANYQQPAELNVEVVINDALRAGNDDQIKEMRTSKKRRR